MYARLLNCTGRSPRYPLKCHEEVLSLQPMIPPKRFDIFPPDWGVMLRRSRCVQICCTVSAADNHVLRLQAFKRWRDEKTKLETGSTKVKTRSRVRGETYFPVWCVCVCLYIY